MSVTRLTTSWLGYDVDTGDLWFWDGAQFRPLVEAAGYATTDALAATQATLQIEIDGKLDASPALLGINTAADTTNRLALKSDAALFSHDDVTPGTGDIRIAVNKSAAGKDAAFVLADAFSARVLLGLLGDDNLTCKVSADGATYKIALTIDKSSAQLDLPQAPKFSAYVNYDFYVAASVYTLVQFNYADHNDQAAFDAGTHLFTAPAAGYYMIGCKLFYKINGANPATGAHLEFYKNGSALTRTEAMQRNDWGYDRLCIENHALLKLAAGDTIAAYVRFDDSDGYVEANSNSFWGARIP